MFGAEKSEADLKLEEAIVDILDCMKAVDCGSDEWLEYCSRLERLKEMSVNDRRFAEDSLSKDTLAMVVGNLLGVAMIVNAERVGIVTSKALGLLLKLK